MSPRSAYLLQTTVSARDSVGVSLQTRWSGAGGYPYPDTGAGSMYRARPRWERGRMHKLPHTLIRRGVPLAALIAALAAPAAASAAPDFTPATTSDGHISPRVAFANGEETETHFELLSQNPVDTRVVVTTRGAGASPSEQLVIPSSGGFLPSSPRIA